ncbi:MAG: MBL fold metallo-hydrolase, partial [Acutalibacteraceae bacterium]
KVLGLPLYVGLDASLINNDRFVFTEAVSVIDEELLLFSGVKEETYFSKSNKKLFVKKQGTMIQDNFEHEQNLIITTADKRILISGCSHSGIVNIQKKGEEIISDAIDIVVGGFHLFNPPTKKYESDEYISSIAQAINKTGSSYYTCHCTGVKAYKRMKPVLGDKLHYLGTGAVYNEEDN